MPPGPGPRRIAIASDLDGVLFDLIGGVQRQITALHGPSAVIPPSRLTSYNVRTWSDDPAITSLIIKCVAESPAFYETLLPIPGTQAALRNLLDAFPPGTLSLIGITSRPWAASQPTQHTCENHFPFFDRNPNGSLVIHHVATKRDSDTKKARTAKTYNCRYAFEDHPGLARTYADHRIHVFVPAQPYNTQPGSTPRSKFIHPVANLQEAVDFIVRREGGKVWNNLTPSQSPI